MLNLLHGTDAICLKAMLSGISQPIFGALKLCLLNKDQTVKEAN